MEGLDTIGQISWTMSVLHQLVSHGLHSVQELWV